ncbi:transmembrane reductase CYB561D2 isoform X1 [Hydra vulgaris]|nr:transmembrane reductase CYB561D2 [Hydra vulgaris]
MMPTNSDVNVSSGQNKKITQVQKSLLIIYTMVHILAVLLAVFIAYIAQPGSSLFSWHPTLMTIGFGLFMFEAILLFSPYSSLMHSADRKTKTKYHWILQLCATVSILLGFAAILINKVQMNKAHFQTWHSIIGLVATVFVSFQALAGFSLIYNIKFLNPFKASLGTRKKMHALYGSIVFLFGMASIFLSLYSNFVLQSTGQLTWYLLLFLVSALSSVIVNQVSNGYLFSKK